MSEINIMQEYTKRYIQHVETNVDNILKLRIMLSKVRLKVLKFEKIYIFEINNHNQNVFCLFSKVCYRKIPHISLSNTVGTSINFAFCEEIIKF